MKVVCPEMIYTPVVWFVYYPAKLGNICSFGLQLAVCLTICVALDDSVPVSFGIAESKFRSIIISLFF